MTRANLEYQSRHARPVYLASSSKVIDTPIPEICRQRAIRNRHKRLSQCGRISWTTELVIHDRNTLPRPGQPQHCCNEIAGEVRKNPRYPDNYGTSRNSTHSFLTIKLALSVNAHWARHIRWQVRRRLSPIEHAIGGQVYQGNAVCVAKTGQFTRSINIQGSTNIRFGLGTIYSRVRPCVDCDFRTMMFQRFFQ